MTDFDRILERTSRTFGLSIPLLNEPVRRELTLAYLLFRVADTLEDAEGKPQSQRLAALAELDRLIETPDRVRAAAFARRCAVWQPSQHAGYSELLAASPALFEAIEQLESVVRCIILHYAGRTVRGMAEFVALGDDDGSLHLDSIESLRRYCYTVAGIVGEMITELFLHRWPELCAVEHALRRDAARFGEGLQLVNILKDAADDARCGRVYLPSETSRREVFGLARESLRCAERYIESLESVNADRSVIAFAALPTRLAWKTLERVEQRGAGAKLARDEVARILQEVNAQCGET